MVRLSKRAALGFLCAAWLVAPAVGLRTQDSSRPAAEQESELDRLLRAATTGRTVIRPQAAQRLVRLWSGSEEGERSAIVARLIEECGETPESLAEAGAALVEILGELEDPTLRALLWVALGSDDFPWRPYAARALATTALAEEVRRFDPLLEDPIAPVRVAGLTALATLDDRERAERVRARLADEDDRVRRAAADLLASWGEESALFWLLEELARTDSFFDRPTGKLARYQASRILGRHVEDLAGFDPELGPTDPGNRAALAELERVVAQRAGEPRPSLPALARAGSAETGEVLGLEIRSCRKGEFFLRWTADDGLLAGQGRPARLPLPEGTTRELIEMGKRTAAAHAGRRFFGAPGCDVEQFLWWPVRDTAAQVWIVSKGPEKGSDLRPPGLGALYSRLVDTLPDVPDEDPRLHHLRRRVVSALIAVGGELPKNGD